jgi:hypothetical protein
MCVKVDSGYDYYPYMDTFKFIDRDGYLYNYQPDVTFWTLCSTDGCKQSRDYLRFDGINKVFRYQHDACWVEYAQMYTHSNNVQWSEINDTYILRNDCIYSDELNDYIFNEEKSDLNNQARIQERIEYMNQRSSRRKKSSSSSWITEYLSRETSELNESTINEIYSRMTAQTGIPPGYFNDLIRRDNQQNEEPTLEPVEQ